MGAISWLSGGPTAARGRTARAATGRDFLFSIVGGAIAATMPAVRWKTALDLWLCIGDSPPFFHHPNSASAPVQSGLQATEDEEEGQRRMNLAFCHDSVLPSRGGCETYIADLARRLTADGHDVHLYARRWDPTALPAALTIHRVQIPRVPRSLRPWVFGAACHRALASANHQVTVGFDKLSGLDVLYRQGGLYAATVAHNLLKYRNPLVRRLAGW